MTFSGWINLLGGWVGLVGTWGGIMLVVLLLIDYAKMGDGSGRSLFTTWFLTTLTAVIATTLSIISMLIASKGGG